MRIEPGQRIRLAVAESIKLDYMNADALGTITPVVAASAAIDGVNMPCTIDGGTVHVTVSPQTLGEHILTVTIDGAELHNIVEICSGHYFSLEELRHYGQNGQTDDFTDTTRYPVEALFWARQAAEETFERNSNMSYVTRKRTEQAIVTRGDLFNLVPGVAQLSAKTAAGATVRAELVSDRQAIVDYCGHVAVTFTYGRTMVEPVKRAVLKLAANYLRPLNRPEQATGESSDYGYISYTLAGRDGATGIPEVDAVIKQFGTVWPLVW